MIITQEQRDFLLANLPGAQALIDAGDFHRLDDALCDFMLNHVDADGQLTTDLGRAAYACHWGLVVGEG